MSADGRNAATVRVRRVLNGDVCGDVRAFGQLFRYRLRRIMGTLRKRTRIDCGVHEGVLCKAVVVVDAVGGHNVHGMDTLDHRWGLRK